MDTGYWIIWPYILGLGVGSFWALGHDVPSTRTQTQLNRSKENETRIRPKLTPKLDPPQAIQVQVGSSFIGLFLKKEKNYIIGPKHFGQIFWG